MVDAIRVLASLFFSKGLLSAYYVPGSLIGARTTPSSLLNPCTWADTPGSPEGNTEGPGTASSEPPLPS